MHLTIMNHFLQYITRDDQMKIINLGNRIVNTYLVKTESSCILIDTGYAEQFPAFNKKLRAINIEVNEIDYILLTHAHDDHAGFLSDILQHSDAKVIMSSEGLENLRKGQNSFDGRCSGRLALFFCKILALLGKGEHKFPSLSEQYEERLIFVEEHNQKEIEQKIQGKIMKTPGHTPCSISLLLNDGSLFCGDAAMNGLPSIHRTTIWVGNLPEYINSWKLMVKVKPRLIYPGHGKPFLARDLSKYMNTAAKKTLHPLRSS